MKHIKEDHGENTNLLELTDKQYNELRPFLLALGIRSRVTLAYTNDYGDKVYVIEAENPFDGIFGDIETRQKIRDTFLSKEAIRAYER